MQLIATFRARPGHEAEVASLLASYAEVVREDDGTELFEPSTDRGDGQSFIVFERYRDKDAFKAHLAAQAGQDFNAALAEHIDGQVALQILNPLARG